METKKIREKIKYGHTEEAIELLLSFTEKLENHEYYDQAVSISSHYSKIKALQIHGVESFDTSSIQGITTRIILLLENLNNINIDEAILGSKSKFSDEIKELKRHLKKGDFKTADLITGDILVKMKGTLDDNQKGLSLIEISNLPCNELMVLDEVWQYYSNGRFGFSVQLQILMEAENSEISLGNLLGWRLNNHWISWSDVTFSLLAPKGHLPICGYTGGLNPISAHTLEEGFTGLFKSQIEIFKSGINDILEPGGLERFSERFLREINVKSGNGFALWWAKGRIPLLNRFKNCLIK